MTMKTSQMLFIIPLQSILTCVVALALGPLPGASAAEMSDMEKRAKIEAMYRDYQKNFADVEDIDPREAMKLLQEGKAVFVDVREAKEQEVSMLPGAITEAQLLRSPEKYGDRILIGYCTISYRSGKLAQKLKAKSLSMMNLRGGLLAWVHDGGKVYDQNGETRRIHVYGRKWDLGPKDYEAVW
jgi:rhodanese-related sulfurtransferase